VFTVAPSTNESIFQAISNLITALRTPNPLGGATAAANFANSSNQALNNIDRGIDNVLTVRATMGTRLRELDAMQSAGESMGVQFKQTLSQLQDVDFNKAISDLTQQKTSLEAAQKSFMAVSGLSLFNYM
ncbi:MAG: flagellin, partial [Candidatus Nitrotoga sp.]